MRSVDLADSVEYLVARLHQRLRVETTKRQVPLAQVLDGIESLIVAVRGRVLGVGADQYDDGSGVQKFEKLPMVELLDWTLEELDDVVVYAGMLRIRVERLKKALAFDHPKDFSGELDEPEYDKK